MVVFNLRMLWLCYDNLMAMDKYTWKEKIKMEEIFFCQFDTEAS